MNPLARAATTFLCAVIVALAAVSVAGCGGGESKSGDTGPMGVSSVIDGNATCNERVTPWVAGAKPTGLVVVSVDDLTFAMDPVQAVQKINSGPNKGLYSFKTPAGLTSERNALLELDRDQIDEARLLYDPIDRDAKFDDVSSTMRFQACQKTDLIGTGEKLGKVTGWAGAIIAKQPELCLRGRLFSERNNESQPIEIPLGKDC